jgi:hypothetical protein
MARAGQPDVNSTEHRTPRVAPERGIGLNPKRGKKRSAVSVSRYASATTRLRESSKAASVSCVRPARYRRDPASRRPTATEGCGFVELEARAPHDASLEAGHKGGGEVALEPVLRETGFVEQFEELGQLLPARGPDGNFRYGFLPPRSSSLMRVRISSRTVLNTSSRSSSPPAAREGSRNDQCRRCFAPGKVGQASLASSQTVTT